MTREGFGLASENGNGRFGEVVLDSPFSGIEDALVMAKDVKLLRREIKGLDAQEAAAFLEYAETLSAACKAMVKAASRNVREGMTS